PQWARPPARVRRPRAARPRARTRGRKTGCRNCPRASGIRSSRRPRPHPPAWSPRSPDRSARPRSLRLPGVAAPALHRGEDAAQDVDLVLVELGALQEAADTRHEMRAALGAITEIDLLEHLR